MHDNISHNMCHVSNIFNIIVMFMIASITCINIILHDMSFKKTVTYKIFIIYQVSHIKHLLINVKMANRGQQFIKYSRARSMRVTSIYIETYNCSHQQLLDMDNRLFRPQRREMEILKVIIISCIINFSMPIFKEFITRMCKN